MLSPASSTDSEFCYGSSCVDSGNDSISTNGSDESKSDDSVPVRRVRIPKLIGIDSKSLKELKEIGSIDSNGDLDAALKLLPKAAIREFEGYITDAMELEEEWIAKTYGDDAVENMKTLTFNQLLQNYDEFIFNCLSYVVEGMIIELEEFDHYHY